MNALPSNTAFEINPSDLIPKADRATLRKRLFSPRIAPRKREEVASVKTVLRSPEASQGPIIWQSADIWFRAHVDAWIEYRSAPIKSYIKQRCRELGVSYLDIMGGSRRRAIIIPKHTLVYEVFVKFQPSYPELAKHFSFSDHTTAIHIVQKFQKHGQVTFNKPTDHADEILAMWTNGKTAKQISVETGCCESSVHSFIKTKGWTR